MGFTQLPLNSGGGGQGPQGPPGPPGPQGPPGPTGSGGLAAGVFNQSTPASTWVVNHNLGFVPSVTLFTPGGVEFIAEIVNTSVNQFQVILNQNAAGSARYI